MRVLPSDLMSLQGSVKRYCFDRCVWLFGSTLDTELESAIQGCKNDAEMMRARALVMDRWFPENRAAKGKFRDPMKLMS